MRWNELNVIFVFLCGGQSCLFTSHIVVIFWHSFEKSLTSISGAGQFLVFSILKVLLFYVSFQWLTIPTCSRRQSEMAHYTYLTRRQFQMADYSYLLEKAVWNGWLFLPALEGSFRWLTILSCMHAREGSFQWLTICTCTRRQFQMTDYSYPHKKVVSNGWLSLFARLPEKDSYVLCGEN